MQALAASSSFGSGARSEACSSRAPQLTEEEAPAGMEVEAGVAAVRFEHKRAQLYCGLLRPRSRCTSPFAHHYQPLDL